MLETFKKTDVVSAVPQASNSFENADSASMECETHNDQICCSRTNHAIVKVLFKDKSARSDHEVKTIKNIIFEKIKVNCIKITVEKETGDYFVFLENDEDAKSFSTYDFALSNLSCETVDARFNETKCLFKINVILL